jgi:hypothetical protein
MIRSGMSRLLAGGVLATVMQRSGRRAKGFVLAKKPVPQVAL